MRMLWHMPRVISSVVSCMDGQGFTGDDKFKGLVLSEKRWELEAFQKEKKDQLKALEVQEEGKAIFEKGTALELLSAPNLKLLLSWYDVQKEGK